MQRSVPPQIQGISEHMWSFICKEIYITVFIEQNSEGS